MSLHFRPMRGLTLAVLICLPVLIGLGVWQYQRWHWKTDILAEIEAAVTAPPLAGLGELDRVLASGDPIDFRRIEIEGTASGPTWHVYAPAGAIEWQPFRHVTAESGSALVGFPVFDDRVKDRIDPPEMDGSRAGYIRRIRPRTGFASRFGAKNNPQTNRWFDVNPDGVWLEDETVFIDLHPTIRKGSDLPVRRPDIANNHVSYMLTWWSFAIILLIIYALLHKRAGRLSWR